MVLAIELPADVEAELRLSLGPDLNRAALEALAAEGYRQRKLGISQVGRLLGLASRFEAEAWLARRAISWNYSVDDLNADRAMLDRLFSRPT